LTERKWWVAPETMWRKMWLGNGVCLENQRSEKIHDSSAKIHCPAGKKDVGVGEKEN